MRLGIVLRVLSLISLIVSLFMVFPLALAVYDGAGGRLAFLASLSALRVEELWTRAEELGARPYEERSAWLGYLQMALRDLLVLREDAGAELYHGDRRADLTSLLPAMPRTRVLALMEEAGTLLRRFGANVNPALQAEAFFLRARQAAQD